MVSLKGVTWLKNKFPPHVLIMTATPIPRTLAMSYGDLDMFIIDEFPPEENILKLFTKLREIKANKIYKSQINKGKQAYITYPLIKGVKS